MGSQGLGAGPSGARPVPVQPGRTAGVGGSAQASGVAGAIHPQRVGRGASRPPAAIERGGIVYGVPGERREEVLAAVARLPGIPASVDRQLLLPASARAGGSGLDERRQRHRDSASARSGRGPRRGALGAFSASFGGPWISARWTAGQCASCSCSCPRRCGITCGCSPGSPPLFTTRRFKKLLHAAAPRERHLESPPIEKARRPGEVSEPPGSAGATSSLVLVGRPALRERPSPPPRRTLGSSRALHGDLRGPLACLRRRAAARGGALLAAREARFERRGRCRSESSTSLWTPSPRSFSSASFVVSGLAALYGGGYLAR